MKRAFTLIELLVVIAIIAILAAILFPVFAQAKAAAKKTAALSQVKQVATGTNIYLADSDDTLPLAGVGSPLGIDTGQPAPFPAGWHTDGFAGSAWADNLSASFWSSSTAPYIKNDDILALSSPGKQLDGWTPASLYTDPTRKKNAKNTSVTYNGYLHGYSSTAINSPSGLTMFWFGVGNVGWKGAAFAQPLLECFNVPTCRFNSSAPPSATAGTNQTYQWGRESADIFTGGGIFVSADSSAKFRKLGLNRGTVAQAGGDWRTDPYAVYNVAGQAPTGPVGSGQIPWTRTTNGVRYILHFMPDQDR